MFSRPRNLAENAYNVLHEVAPFDLFSKVNEARFPCPRGSFVLFYTDCGRTASRLKKLAHKQGYGCGYQADTSGRAKYKVSVHKPL